MSFSGNKVIKVESTQDQWFDAEDVKGDYTEMNFAQPQVRRLNCDALVFYQDISFHHVFVDHSDSISRRLKLYEQ